MIIYGLKLPDLFLPTPSARRATAYHRLQHRLPADFYPRPPRGGRPGSARAFSAAASCISTHALREEGDRYQVDFRAVLDISTHALREEGDQRTHEMTPAGGHFYPRPPRGGRLSSSVF